MTEIWRMGAAELATRIRARDVSSREVVEAHLDRIQAVNPKTQRGDRGAGGSALAAADAADAAVRSGEAPGPLCGVPMTVKENMDVAGSATTFGLAVLRNAIAKEDGPLVASAARRRRDPDRTHQHARVRRALAHRERALGRHAQPVVGRAHAGRVERRRGGGARGRSLAARPRQRRRRVAALAGAVLRRRRAQALVRARAPRFAGARAGATDPVRVPTPRRSTDRWRATCATCGWPSPRCARDRWATPGTSPAPVEGPPLAAPDPRRGGGGPGRARRPSRRRRRGAPRGGRARGRRLRRRAARSAGAGARQRDLHPDHDALRSHHRGAALDRRAGGRTSSSGSGMRGIRCGRRHAVRRSTIR